MSETTEHAHDMVDEDKRDFIHIASGMMAAGGAAMVGWMFVDQMNPAADTQAASSLEVDISKVKVGEEIRILIGGKPFFVRHRTEEEILAAVAANEVSMKDPQTDADRLIPKPDGALNPAILVTSGACTHLGCVPVGPGNNTGDFGGWYCPCHGSHYDTSGRIRRGPAPKNLEIPKYEYVSDAVIRISL